MNKIIGLLFLGLIMPQIGWGQGTLASPVLDSRLLLPAMPQYFSGTNWNNDGVSVIEGHHFCIPCHTPHIGNLDIKAPLWTPNFAPHAYLTEDTLSEQAVPEAMQIDGSSKVCLCCHDGIVAFNTYGSRLPAEYNTGYDKLAIDLSLGHPVSVNYAHALAAGHGMLKPLANHGSGINPVSHLCNSDKPDNLSLLDEKGKVQCTSCHGSHANSCGYRLRAKKMGAQLCITCHG